MDEQGTTKPAPPPTRARPGRRRRHQPLERPHVAHRMAGDTSARTIDRTTDHAEAQTKAGGGGASGRGPVDDDGSGRRPDRNDDDARYLLIALGLIAALGATVMRARRLAKAGRPTRTA